MRNILFIHQSAELYGSDKTLLLFLQNIDRDKFSAVVVLPNEGPLKEALEKLGIKVVIAPVSKLYRDMFSFKNLYKFITDIRQGFKILNQLHKEHHFQLVYSNTLAVLIGMVFSKWKKISHIWHVHEIIEHPKPIAWLFPKLLYFFSDKIICNSEATKKNLVDQEKRNEAKTVVVYNGIETNEAVSFATKQDFGFGKSDIVITLIGRISRLKGHNWMLKAFNSLIERHGNARLLFVGSPVPGQEFYLENVESYIRKNKLEEYVRIRPFTLDLKDTWNITDIAVMPSTEKESFGLVAAEAMLEKKPVIGADHGGLKEIIVDNETGFLVKPNNVAELAHCLEKLILEKEKRETFGRKGFERASVVFSLKNYVSQIEQICLEQSAQKQAVK